MSNQTDPDKLRRVVQFYESLTIDSIAQIGTVYAAGAFFKDPFNEVTGLPDITDIFRHMFEQVDEPRFVVTSQVLQLDTAFMAWDFLFRMKRFSSDPQCIRGATHLRFNHEGLVDYHRDYWDAAEELYEKLPVLGGLMRVLKRAARK